MSEPLSYDSAYKQVWPANQGQPPEQVYFAAQLDTAGTPLQLAPPATAYVVKLAEGGAGDVPQAPAVKGEIRVTFHGGVRPDHTMFDSIAEEKALAQEP